MSGASTIDIGGNHWTLGRTLGSGGFGRVYAATSDTQAAAIKLVPKDRGAERELLVSDSLRGAENVLPVWGVGETDRFWAILMPKADKSLRTHLVEAGGPLREAEARPILIDLARALTSLREVGVVHRDLKPENILLYDGRWCLSDFGIVRYAEAAEGLDTRKYSTTRPYAAPEQWQDDDVTSATDVYALGVLCYELLAGSLPFPGPNFRRQHLHDRPRTIPGITAPLAALIDRCLIKAPGARPAPRELLARLEASANASPSQGIAALQEADRAAAGHRVEEVRTHTSAQSEGAVRNALLQAAQQQYQRIAETVKQTILAAATMSRPVERYGLKESLGWTLSLNGAMIEFSNLDGDSASQLPFDVVAWAYVVVESKPGPKDGYRGRAHSLWFCDVEESGTYAWYEVGFVHEMPDVILGAPNSTYMPRAGLFRPNALNPRHVSASALANDQMIGVIWPFTQVEIHEFCDRWIKWFAEASRGVLREPAKPTTARTAYDPSLTTSSRSRASSGSSGSHAPCPAQEVRDILQWVEYALGDGDLGSLATRAVGPEHLSRDEREWVVREVRPRLSLSESPALAFRRLSDKAYRDATAIGGPIGWVTARVSPLRFEDGTRYEEFTYVSKVSNRVALVERREPSKAGQHGRLLAAFVLVVPETSGAVVNGAPSRSLRRWFDGPEMMLPNMSESPRRRIPFDPEAHLQNILGDLYVESRDVPPTGVGLTEEELGVPYIPPPPLNEPWGS
jgi:hypothetical protein